MTSDMLRAALDDLKASHQVVPSMRAMSSALHAALSKAPAKALMSAEQAKAMRPLPFSNAELDRLYANIPPTAQQDARSREAFKRLARIVEAGHDIVSKPPQAGLNVPVQPKEPTND